MKDIRILSYDSGDVNTKMFSYLNSEYKLKQVFKDII